MKVFFKIIVLFFPFVLFSQDLPIDKLLLTKKYIRKTIPTNILYSTNFASNIFALQKSDFLIKYNSSEFEDNILIDKKIGNCIILNFNKSDFINVIDKLDTLVKVQYNFFKDENRSDYKDYLAFINKGLIIVTLPSNNQIILIYMNTCIFKINEQKIIKYIECNGLFNKSYVFSCGGKDIFKKIK